MRNKFVTFGEVLLRLKSPSVERLFQSERFEATFCGAEVNVAVSLANYGLNASFVTATPDNDVSRACIGELRRFGVDTSNIAYTKGRFGVFYLETGACQRASKVTYDRDYTSFANIKEGDFDWEKLFEDACWFHVSGITAAITEDTAKEALRAVQIAKKLGVTVSLDLNFRAKLWQYGKAPTEIMPEIARYADVLISGGGDFQKMLGIIPETDDDSLEVNLDTYRDICDKALAAYPELKCVAITIRRSLSGDHNTWAACINDRSGFYYTRTYDIADIVDRVGGGDAFAGGLIYGLHTKKTAAEAVEFATAASTLKHSIFGDFNRVTVEEVESLMQGDGTVRIAR
ncbi:MAG: sugar kinase [Clostridia bacterium]|nr:sugar kinase [Clostridia bacterium]